MRTRKLVVLIVEDSLLIISRILDMLEEAENVKLVIHASNFSESMKMINEINADVVLLDINLPDKSGIELLQVIKTSHPQTKVIILTNHACEDYRQLCNHMGADFFFDKSNDFEKIPEAIRSLN